MEYCFYKSLTHLQLGIYLLSLFFVTGYSYKFKNNYTGIIFDPYVKQSEPGVIDVQSYTKENIETMLTVISQKFTKLLVQDTYLQRGKTYIENFTYYYGSQTSLYTGEVAALINQRNKEKRLTVKYGVNFSPQYNIYIEEDIVLVFEAANLANKIFPGTVDAISLMFNDLNDLLILQQKRESLQLIKNDAAAVNMSLGFSLNGFNITETIELINSYPQFFSKADLISLQNGRDNYSDGLTPVNYFSTLKQKYLDIRDSLRKINSNAEVSAVTGWASSLVEGEHDVEGLRSYWEAVSTWAAQYQILIYLNEAFDTPWKKFAPPNEHMGWWRLSDDSKINLISGYVEKVLEIETERVGTDSNFFNWNGRTFSLMLGGGVTLILIAALLLVLVIYHVRKQGGLSSSEIRAFIFGALLPAGEGATSVIDNVNGLPYDKSLEIPKENLKIDKASLLGSGHFGFVFSGHLKTDDGEVIKVAVKVSKNKCSTDAINGLLYEIKIMSYLEKHPNVVALMGAYTAELSRGVVHVVSEICNLGSLESFLRNRGSSLIPQSTASNMEEIELTPVSSITIQDMTRWSYEIACGMEHVQGKRVVHADLATRNILLTSDKTAKIADFGMSRHLSNYTQYIKKSKHALPWRWMAIESLKKMEFSSKSDVWSYGITLWEIFSMGDTPYPGSSCTPEFIDELVHGLRPKCPSSVPTKYYQLMRNCWDFLPTERPNFSELVRYTRNWLEKRENGSDDDTELNYIQNSGSWLYTNEVP